MWQAPIPAYASATHLAPNLAIRRHRSMTPHAPNQPTYMAENWLADVSRVSRPFPHAVDMFPAPFADDSYHRATSLDPSTLNVRATLLHLQVPNAFDRLATGPANVRDEQRGRYNSQGQTDQADMNQLDPSTFSELKTSLADEFTNSNWEQHNA
jgi:hypothetical protein